MAFLGGSDGTTSGQPANSSSPYFYSGQGGGGTNQSTTGYGAAWSTSAASQAGAAYTYVYWTLWGMANAPGTYANNPTGWGQAQAKSCVHNWNILNGNGTVSTTLIWADIEEADGWDTSKYGQSTNQEILQGFASYITQSGLQCGVYSGPGPWQTIMSSTLDASQVSSDITYVWTNEPCCTTSFPTSWNAKPLVTNGVTPLWWQYSEAPDYDAAEALPDEDGDKDGDTSANKDGDSDDDNGSNDTSDTDLDADGDTDGDTTGKQGVEDGDRDGDDNAEGDGDSDDDNETGYDSDADADSVDNDGDDASSTETIEDGDEDGDLGSPADDSDGDEGTTGEGSADNDG